VERVAVAEDLGVALRRREEASGAWVIGRRGEEDGSFCYEVDKNGFSGGFGSGKVEIVGGIVVDGNDHGSGVFGLDLSVVLEGEVESLADEGGCAAGLKSPDYGAVSRVDVVNCAHVARGDEVIPGKVALVDGIDVTNGFVSME